ncbi:MAG: PilZ domain-containing protein [Acidobacteria bacterium]|nr:PilZ domain-containing protein [Acidobacteriota bacterium]
MKPRLTALLLSSDEKLVRVLRRVLSDMDVVIEHSTEPDLAIAKLTRERFDAVIVDCSHAAVASRILGGIRSSITNKRAITMAVLDPQSPQGEAKEACEAAAHFVLSKPVSPEQSRAVFPAARALMNRERRRRARIRVELPVDLRFGPGGGVVRVLTSDLGEDGMAVNFDGERPYGSTFPVEMSLPGDCAKIQCCAQVAWEGGRMTGVRFCDMDADTARLLRHWIQHQLEGADVEDCLVRSKLADLSVCACYLQTESPFPVGTRLSLMMKIGDLELQIEGVVQVMHSGRGMGVEFKKTSEHREQLEQFIETLWRTSGAIPDLEVRPESIDGHVERTGSELATAGEGDPLLSLFISKRQLPAELFQAELRKQRRAHV